ncbi:MAG: hypothetical protein U5K74_16390 [Gemmatimonadaceae bacterium]|nr:hypothetical protein [Gemmatimonadaceae bacterium]
MIGLALPFVIEGAVDATSAPMLFMLVVVSVLLVAVFTALAFVVTVLVHDRARGLAVAMLAWLGMGVLYDGLVLTLATMLRDWPIERGMLVAMVLNPIDLARTILLAETGCRGPDGLHRCCLPRGVQHGGWCRHRCGHAGALGRGTVVDRCAGLRSQRLLTGMTAGPFPFPEIRATVQLAPHLTFQL